MARKAYVGVGDAAKRIKRAYIGIDGKARLVKKIYVGVNGIAQLACELKSLTISYNANGGNGTVPSSQTSTARYFSAGDTVTFTTATHSLTKSGYMFKYWTTNQDGTGTKVKAGGTISVSANTTLYAQWVRMTSIHWAKTANINDAADWITDVENATGPVLNGPNNGFYLGTIIKINYASDEPHYWTPTSAQLSYANWDSSKEQASLNWNQTFSGGGRETKVFEFPETANVICYLANHFNNNGGPTCCVYGGDDTNQPVLAGPGETVTWGTPMTKLSYISMWANWKTSGAIAEIVGWDGIWPITKDTRQSWWDLHVTMHALNN